MSNARNLAHRAQDYVSVRDFGAVGDGVTDDTAAIQAALTYAHSISIGTVSDPNGNMNAGSVTVEVPAGKYIVSGKLSFYESTSIKGAGPLSTIIQSSYNGNVLESQPGANYGLYSVVIDGLCIVGDRTKTSQVGLALLRPVHCVFQNLIINSCGSHGLVLREGLLSRFLNIQSMLNVGAGFYVTDGTVSWSNSTPTNLPTNDCEFTSCHGYYNDASGFATASLGTAGVNGCNINGGAFEYNYYSSSAGTGYNIELIDNPYMPCEFVNVWCEGPVNAHVYQNMNNSGCPTRFIDFHNFGGGTSSYPNRAIIVEKGTMVVENSYGHSVSYRSITGAGGTSNAPFRVNKASGNAHLWLSFPRGSNISNDIWCEDETQATTGLGNVFDLINFRNIYAKTNFRIQFGDLYPSITQEGQSYPQMYYRTFDGTNGALNGLAFGSGTVAADTNLIRYSAGILGMGAGNSFQLNGASGATIKYTNGTANGAVATTLGSVGPTGSTAGNPQGWLRVNIGGTDRYIPYW